MRSTRNQCHTAGLRAVTIKVRPVKTGHELLRPARRSISALSCPGLRGLRLRARICDRLRNGRHRIAQNEEDFCDLSLWGLMSVRPASINA